MIVAHASGIRYPQEGYGHLREKPTSRPGERRIREIKTVGPLPGAQNHQETLRIAEFNDEELVTSSETTNQSDGH